MISMDRGPLVDAFCCGPPSRSFVVQILFDFFFKKLLTPFFPTEPIQI